jgi:hypothetical protein
MNSVRKRLKFAEVNLLVIYWRVKKLFHERQLRR